MMSCSESGRTAFENKDDQHTGIFGEEPPAEDLHPCASDLAGLGRQTFFWTQYVDDDDEEGRDQVQATVIEHCNGVDVKSNSIK
jgi:hypothetical protein